MRASRSSLSVGAVVPGNRSQSSTSRCRGRCPRARSGSRPTGSGGERGDRRGEEEPLESSPRLGRGTKVPPPVACAGSECPRARNESKKARQAGQPPPGVLEGAAATVHRTPLLQEIREGAAGGRDVG